MTDDLLHQIQTLQFRDKRQAEKLLLDFLRDIYAPDVTQVELRPLAVSLNSFNGFLTLADGKRLFFKTHIEADGVIGEYYHAAQLAQAGYPVIQPIFSSTEAGKQLLIYEVVEEPSVFDVAWKIENGDKRLLPSLTQAQHEADEMLLQLYENTLVTQTADAADQAPIHQLFYHRITGGRMERFYGLSSAGEVTRLVPIALPGGQRPFSEVRSAKWIINGQHYDETIGDLIPKTVTLLQPAQSGPSIVGHGDAHNGNVFLQEPPALLYFDPAFAGRHHPLLDLTKPLFHNVFAMWMYFPQGKRDATRISLKIDGNDWLVEHNYAIPPIRKLFLESKIQRVLIPILQVLRGKGWLREDWRAYLKAALFCCPFLTMNLADSVKFPPEISLLGLAMAVEMGAESQGERSLIDRTLDAVERELA